MDTNYAQYGTQKALDNDTLHNIYFTLHTIQYTLHSTHYIICTNYYTLKGINTTYFTHAVT